MKSSDHRQTVITLFYRHRAMTATGLSSVSAMSVATARRTLNDLRDRGYLSKDGQSYHLAYEPLFYAPLDGNLEI